MPKPPEIRSASLAAKKTAELIVCGIERYNAEIGQLTRFQLSTRGLSTISDREIIDNHFLELLGSELLARKWCMFQISNSNYSFIRQESASAFKKISGDTLIKFHNQFLNED